MGRLEKKREKEGAPPPPTTPMGARGGTEGRRGPHGLAPPRPLPAGFVVGAQGIGRADPHSTPRRLPFAGESVPCSDALAEHMNDADADPVPFLTRVAGPSRKSLSEPRSRRGRSRKKATLRRPSVYTRRRGDPPQCIGGYDTSDRNMALLGRLAEADEHFASREDRSGRDRRPRPSRLASRPATPR